MNSTVKLYFDKFGSILLFYQKLQFSLKGDTFKSYNSTKSWPISDKFAQILEKFKINIKLPGNSIILKVLSLKVISMHSVRMFVSQF